MADDINQFKSSDFNKYFRFQNNHNNYYSYSNIQIISVRMLCSKTTCRLIIYG